VTTKVLVDWTQGWGKLPSFLINIVFACLFLGVTIPNIKQVWRRAGPQLAYGQVVAWGQYVVGIGLFLVLIQFVWPELPTMFAGILPVGFEGGHGTASGMEPVFVARGWEAGKDFAMASATAGILGAVIVGMALVNWAARKGYTTQRAKPEDIPEDESIGVIPIGQRPEAGKLTVHSAAVESMTLHVAIIGGAMLIGLALKKGLGALGDLSGGEGTFAEIMRSFPLFPLCMIGGLVVQLLEQKYDRHKLIDIGLVRRIQNLALDFLVVAAIATIRVDALAGAIVPFLLLVAAGILWNVFCVVFLARRMLPDAWFERSIAEMGQSMGVTATGLLLLRVVDPEYKSPAADAFAYKQILHEPFMGGGLWTSMAIPLLAVWGGWPVFGITCGAVAAWMFVVFVLKPFPKAVGSK
jgi:ESS family glutamate:Na+ symporter